MGRRHENFPLDGRRNDGSLGFGPKNSQLFRKIRLIILLFPVSVLPKRLPRPSGNLISPPGDGRSVSHDIEAFAGRIF
jgi:hypothetical protein